jgi:radical SAM enzyme (TIGR01210 family)
LPIFQIFLPLSKIHAMKDKTRPLFHWYVDCATGKELVFALYTRPCRYGRCLFCALPTMSEGGEAISYSDIEAQIDFILSNYSEEQKAAITKVSVYTASSSLDQECLPTRSLLYLALKVSSFQQLLLLSLETRPEYVEDWELKMLQQVFNKKVKIEVGIGYETYSPELRNTVLKKGLSVEALHRLMKQLAIDECTLKAYLMLKPHYSLTEEAGIVEAKNGVKELSDLSLQYSVSTSVHLNPTYIAKGCRLTDEMKAAGYQPPELSSVIEVVKYARELNLNIYVGLDDEGMAIEGGTFRHTGLDKEKTVAALQQFNRHQDIDRLMKAIVS